MKKQKKQDLPKLSDKNKIKFEVLYEFLIGKNVKIVDSNNKLLVGLEGILVYESANLFHIKVGEEVKKVLKSLVVIQIDYAGKKLNIDGKLLLGTISTRIKKIK